MRVSASIVTTRLGMRAVALLALVSLFSMLLSPALIVRADFVTNNVVVGGNDTISAGGSTTITYTINVQGTGQDGEGGCNAITASPATVTLSVPAAVSASTTSLQFTGCGASNAKTVTFSSSTAGSYLIDTSSVTDSGPGTYTIQSDFTLKVNPPANTQPTLTLPANITAEATGPTGAVVSYIATASDTQDGTLTPSCTPASGATFPLGPTTVNCSVTDSGGLTATGSFTVTVVDTTAPVVTVPANITEEATGPGGAQVSFSASASDAVSGTPAATCNRTSGTTFSIGTTTVTCSAMDTAGNTGSSSFTITVVDTSGPVVTVPDDITEEATSVAGAVVTFEASATDSVDGALTPTCVPASGSTFALGTTTVTCTATDAHGNTGSDSFDITVEDTTGPVLDLPDDITTEATGPSGAAVTFSASAEDAVDGAVDVTCDPESGATFPLGATTVNCSAVDSEGNQSTGSFTVTVRDTTAPVVTVPADFQVEATGAAGADVTFSASAADLVDGDVPVTCEPSSGSIFALGQTPVTCSATDSAGNEGSASFVVTVEDTTGPVISVPADITAEATSSAGAAVTYIVTASDLVDGDVAVTCTPASGTTFPLGTNAVNCSATDAAGNTSSDSFDVTVEDTTAPVITEHDDVTAEATGPDGATVNYESPTTSDAVDGDGVAQCTPASGTTFALGTTTVTCTATDAAGNPADAVTFDAIVEDTTAPIVTAPADQTVEATGPDGATATYSGQSASDIVDGAITPTCLPASGSTFPLGANTVTCSATDVAGNTGTDTFTITVEDTTAPVIAPHDDVTAEATGPDGATVTYTAPATSDAVDGAGEATCAPASGTLFALGTTLVTCTAEDAAGNDAEPVTFDVIVEDTTAPTVTALANVTAEATGPGGADVTYSGESATDIVDGDVAVTCSPVSGSTFELGSTTVTCSATDAAGNTGSATFSVLVQDTTGPDLTLPANFTVDPTGFTGAAVTYSASASDLVSGSVSVTCAPASGSTFAIGTTTVHCNAADGAGNTSSGSFTVTVRPLTIRGFYAPVDMNGVQNTVKGGSTVPLKFEVFAGSTEITGTAGITFAVTKVSCSSTATLDEIEMVSTGGTILRYDATGGQFIQNWQTPKGAGICYQVTVSVGGDSESALFKTK